MTRCYLPRLDLKVLSSPNGGYVLWLVDLFSKMIKGKYIRDKHPETILDAIVSSWVIGDGSGPGVTMVANF